MVKPNKNIEAWIREAGPREAVPPERAERVRRAVRNEWQAQLDMQRRRRRGRLMIGWAAAAVLMFAVVALRWDGIPGSVESPASVGVVSAIHGSVWLRDASSDLQAERTLLAPTDSLQSGTELITSPTSQVALLLAEGGSIRVSEDAVLRMTAARRFALDRGAVYVDSKQFDGSSTQPLEIETPFGIARNLGTQFEVKVRPDSLRVRVRSGRVSVREGDTLLEVGALEQLEVGPRMSPIRGNIASHSTEWDWIARTVPPMEIEGRSLGQFLQWIARERGWRLEVMQESGAAGLDTIELNGSIEGMTLDQALESVMLTSRWSYRLEDGLLQVEPMTE